MHAFLDAYCIASHEATNYRAVLRYSTVAKHHMVQWTYVLLYDFVWYLI